MPSAQVLLRAVFRRRLFEVAARPDDQVFSWYGGEHLIAPHGGGGYASVKYEMTAVSKNQYTPLDDSEAKVIRDEFQKSLQLMPNFGPANDLFGFFEMVQGENLGAAEQHLKLAVQLEPEDPSFLLTLAQIQLKNNEAAAARQTLKQLLLSNVQHNIHEEAVKLLQEIDRDHTTQ